MKKILLILFVIFKATIQLEASQLPENLTPITINNIGELQSILEVESDYRGAIYDVEWYEDEDINVIVFGGISGLFYIDLNAEDIVPTHLAPPTFYDSVIYGIAINHENKSIAVSDGRTVYLIDFITSNEIISLEHDFVNSIAFTNDGTYLATGDSIGRIKIWNTLNYELIHTLEVDFDNAVVDLEFNEDGTILVSGHQRFGIHFWNLVKNPPSLSILSGNAQILNFSPDFEAIAVGYWSASTQPNISVWDIEENGETLLNGHTEQTTSLMFNNTGDILVSGGDDHSIKFWDVSSNQEIFSLEEHYGLVSAVEFNENQTMFVSGSWDGKLIVWGIVED